MSTILKALRRVEEEHASGPGAPRRALRGDLVGGAQAPPPRRKRGGPNWKLWGSLGALLLLVGLVWWRLPRPGNTEIVQAVPAPVEPQAAPAEAAPEPEPTPPAAVAAAAPEPPPVAPEAPASAVPREVAERLPPLGAPLEAAPAERAAEPAAAPPAAKPSAVASAPKPAPAPALESAPPPPAAPAPPSAPPAPTVEVERTSWHPSPERRVAWVRVEGLAGTRELHEGDGIGTLVVREIRPSSVLFQHGSVQLQRRVGER